MNPARMKAIEASLSCIAKKVLASVPISEAWPTRQVVADIGRSGSMPDYRIVEGCLWTLVDSGLVKEPRRGFFQRVQASTRDGSTKEKVEAMTNKPATQKAVENTPKPKDAFERIATVAAELRALSARCRDLAGEAEEAALAMEEKVARAHADNAKLRQLQELLKGIAQ